MQDQWNHKIFNITPGSFDELALEVFRFQYENNPVYKAYIDTLHIKPGNVRHVHEIPFLPIELFKSHQVKTTSFEAVKIFESSGTTGSHTSRHFVKDISYYEESFTRCFERFCGSVKEYCIICLLPSYLERKPALPAGRNSSLVYMADKLINLSEHPQSDFYLNEFEKLYAVLNELGKREQKTLLLGVTFALLDFAEKYSLHLKNTLIMETGGMKGRRDEMIRSEVHLILKNAFGVDTIHSEYGMTELFSQAYSKKDGIFNFPLWAKTFVRDDEDPFLVKTAGVGAINIIDLANIYSCSFIATDDVGKVNDDGSFEITGRMDNSDLRGCSLLVVN